MSGEIEKEILTILEEAIKREKSAQNLYGKGVKLTKNEEIQRVLEKLQQEELQHEELLRDIYYDYKKRLGLKVLEKEDVSGKQEYNDFKKSPTSKK